MRIYKLTDKNNQTYGGMQWGEEFTHTTSGEGNLCGPGWIHCYHDPLLAVLLNPIHANFPDPHLWEGEGDGKCKEDCGLKWGYTSVRTLHQIHVPKFTIEQKIEFAIRCALRANSDPNFVSWANAWLDNRDRSGAAARAAAWAAETAAWAAETAAWAAARTAARTATRAAARTATGRVEVAESAAWATQAAPGEVDLPAIAAQAYGGTA